MPKPVLTIEHACLELGGRQLLADIDLELLAGDFALLLGSNGAGKSSLIRVIMGELPLSTGSVRCGRVKLIAQDPRLSTFDDLTIRENCRLLTHKDCRQHLADFHPRFIEMLDRPVRALSGGERQVLALALALIDPPDLLLLDEHTSALDPLTAARVMELTVAALERYGIATLMTTHNLEHAESYGTRILALRGGELVVDEASLSRDELLDRCYCIS